MMMVSMSSRSSTASISISVIQLPAIMLTRLYSTANRLRLENIPDIRILLSGSIIFVLAKQPVKRCARNSSMLLADRWNWNADPISIPVVGEMDLVMAVIRLVLLVLISVVLAVMEMVLAEAECLRWIFWARQTDVSILPRHRTIIRAVSSQPTIFIIARWKISLNEMM